MDVIVGCKLPHGIVIKVGDKTVKLNGANSTRIIGGHGLTTVNGDLFATWMKEHKDFAPVKQGLIFAHESANKVESEAKEKVANPSGFEPINPDNPGGDIEPTDEMKKQLKKVKAE